MKVAHKMCCACMHRALSRARDDAARIMQEALVLSMFSRCRGDARIAAFVMHHPRERDARASLR
jgi:hypothetical protein